MSETRQFILFLLCTMAFGASLYGMSESMRTHEAIVLLSSRLGGK